MAGSTVTARSSVRKSPRPSAPEHAQLADHQARVLHDAERRHEVAVPEPAHPLLERTGRHEHGRQPRLDRRPPQRTGVVLRVVAGQVERLPRDRAPGRRRGRRDRRGDRARRARPAAASASSSPGPSPKPTRRASHAIADRSFMAPTMAASCEESDEAPMNLATTRADDDRPARRPHQIAYDPPERLRPTWGRLDQGESHGLRHRLRQHRPVRHRPRAPSTHRPGRRGRRLREPLDRRARHRARPATSRSTPTTRAARCPAASPPTSPIR